VHVTGTQLLAYASFSDVYGSSITFEQLCNQLSAFSQESVLYLCSYITNTLQLWDRTEPNFDAVVLIHNKCFSRRLSVRLTETYYSKNPDTRRVTFHRQQLLLIAKLAIKHCTSVGIDATVNTMQFGIYFLHANDQLHHGLISKMGLQANTPEELAATLVDTLSAVEYSSLQIPNLFARARAMCLEIPPLLKDHKDYVDIESMFDSGFGLPLRLYQYLIFAVASRFGKNLALRLILHPEDLPFNMSQMIRTDVPRENLASFLRIISGSLTNLKLHPSLERTEQRDHSKWFSDLTVIRQYPLINLTESEESDELKPRLLLDHFFLFEKVISEPYFKGMQKSPGFSRFWGAVFERYVHAIMRRAHSGLNATYIPNPKLRPSDNDELCDGVIISGDSIVLLEYKSSIMRADCKYGGDPKSFLTDFKSKYVFDERDQNPKAAKQLAAAVKKLFSSDQVEWLNKSKVRRCSVLLVTLDGIGGAIAASTILDFYFQEELEKLGRPDIHIDPFFCCNIETLEMTSGSLNRISLPAILQRWLSANPSRATPLGAFRMEDVLKASPEWVWSAWEDFSTEAVNALFSTADVIRRYPNAPLTFTLHHDKKK
jgi:hypothetical protein